MKKRIGFLGIILTGLLMLSSCAYISKQYKLSRIYGQLGIDFGNKESILRLEKDPNLFEWWINWKPIELLMTHEEKKLAKKILKMENKKDRELYIEKFIEWFWTRRDDNPDDDRNEFKDNFYDRVIKAQELFANQEGTEKRRAKYGLGWESDMGIIYITLGEPFDKARYYPRELVNFMGGYYQNSVTSIQEIEVWYYDFSDFDLENYSSFLFQDVVWILFEKDYFGFWQFGEQTFNLFYNYENYYQYYFLGGSLSYSYYLGEVYDFIKAVAQSYIYDEDLTFEDMFFYN